jgi:hypothetical protein
MTAAPITAPPRRIDPSSAETVYPRAGAIPLADIYALVAAFFGAFFIVLTPPFGVGDETTHVERAYEVARGDFLGGEGLPVGMQRFVDDAFARVKSGEAARIADFERWAAIPLEADRIEPYPDPLRAIMRLQYPGNYVHLAPAMSAAVAVGAPPLAILYLLRVVALSAGVLLVRQAIRIAPAAFRPAMLFIALLPTTLVFFSGVNNESVLIGLAFLWFAFVASLAARPEARLTRADIAGLIALGFILGQFKSGYFLLPALALILPGGKFSSPAHRILILLLTIAPGAAVSFLWMATAKSAMLGDIAYSTAPGNRVAPDEQIAFILGDPLRYAGIVIKTLFLSPEGGEALRGVVGLGGWTNIPLAPPFYALLLVAGLLLWASGEEPPAAIRTPFALLVQAGLFGGVTLLILTMMYIGWTGVGADLIDGFQGRYWLPLSPLALALAPVRLSLLSSENARAALAVAAPLAGLVGMAAAILTHYY